MGKKKPVEVNPKETLPVKTGRRELAKSEPIRYAPVDLLDMGEQVNAIEGLPDGFENAETLAGFPPSPEWKNPGDTLFGDFIGVKTDVGPNKSRLYEIAAFQGEGKDLLGVAVWGSAALDRLFDSAYPPIQTGDRIGIIYLGEKPTNRGLNPVKLFALKVLRAGQKKVSSLHSA